MPLNGIPFRDTNNLFVGPQKFATRHTNATYVPSKLNTIYVAALPKAFRHLLKSLKNEIQQKRNNNKTWKNKRKCCRRRCEAFGKNGGCARFAHNRDSGIFFDVCIVKVRQKRTRSDSARTRLGLGCKQIGNSTHALDFLPGFDISACEWKRTKIHWTH